MPLSRSSVVAAALAVAVFAASAPAPLRADVFELADGTRLDGKVVQEKDGFVWIRTLTETRKVAAAEVRSRTEGESPADVLAALRAKVEKDPKDAGALWDLYLFLTAHAEESKDLAKEAKTLPPKVLRIDPDHEAARDAVGEVRFEDRWVKKSDLERLRIEAERKRKQDEWQKKLGVPVEVAEGEHWTLVDNTGAKDLSKKVQELDEAYRMTAEALGVDKFWDGTAPAVAMKRYDDYARVLDESWKNWQIAEWRYQAARHPENAGLWLHRPTAFQIRAIPETKTDAEDGMWAALVHNVVHVAIWSQPRASEPPAWLEEGLASIVESEVRGIQKAYCVGISADDRAKTTDKPKRGGKDGNKGLAGEQQVFKEHCKRAVDDNEFPEMRKFVRMKLGEFGPVEAGGSIGLVTWLRLKDPEKFKELWAQLRAGAKDDEPWRKVYGWNLIEEMEKEWRTWVRAEW